MALHNILIKIRGQVVLAELPSCLPLVLEALQSTETPLLVSTLQTVEALLGEASQAMAEHATFLIRRLLELTQAPSMVVRRKALKALQAMTELPLHTVSNVLGDKKEGKETAV